MTVDELTRIESEINITLPRTYKEVLANNPLASEFPGEEITQLKIDCEALMSANNLWRERDYYGRPWPENAFWVGSDGGGGAYFIVCDSDTDSAVYYIDWENRLHDFSDIQQLQVAGSIPAYLDLTRRDMRELLAEFDED